MSLSGATTAVKAALWERKYRCKTKGRNIYTKFIKNQYNRIRRYSKLELLDWEQEQIDDMLEANEAALTPIEEEFDALADYDDYDWYDDWDESDYIYDQMIQEELQEQKEKAWKQFEAALNPPEDDLESAFNGDWLLEIA